MFVFYPTIHPYRLWEVLQFSGSFSFQLHLVFLARVLFEGNGFKHAEIRRETLYPLHSQVVDFGTL